MWRIDIAEQWDRLPELREWLNTEELQRASRFMHEGKQRQFVVCRAALRDILAQYLGLRPRDVAFGYAEHGKPRLANAELGNRLRFNLTHSRHLALCAVTAEQEVGVDAEYIRPDRADESLARRFFARGEVAALMAVAEADHPRAFYRCWTSKEAYLKALGDGLQRPLDSFCVAVDRADAALLEVDDAPDEARRWTFKALPAPLDYAATCVVSGTPSAWQLLRWVGRR